MRVFRVRDDDLHWLTEQPETAMAVQAVVLAERGNSLSLVIVVGGRVVWDLSLYDEEGTVGRLLDQPWLSGAEEGVPSDHFEGWVAQLPAFDRTLREGRVVDARFWTAPSGPFQSPPAPPASIYGHLPFTGRCGGDEVFYRWEPFPTSGRIDQSSGAIKPGTFTAPASEVQFVASGFGAVGRYALPALPPANWRWELRPPKGASFRCGASVPLYGQAGGGVEAFFDTGFNNVGPIANPMVLPSL